MTLLAKEAIGALLLLILKDQKDLKYWISKPLLSAKGIRLNRAQQKKLMNSIKDTRKIMIATET